MTHSGNQAEGNNGSIKNYQLVHGYKRSGNVVHNVNARNIEEVRAWAMRNVDTTKMWRIELDGVKVGEGLAVAMVAINTSNHYDGGHEFVSVARFLTSETRLGWFYTEKEAWEDYAHHKKLADKELDRIHKQVTASLDENGRGDLPPYYLNIELVLSRYKFKKILRTYGKTPMK